jgi:hypothetical protein
MQSIQEQAQLWVERRLRLLSVGHESTYHPSMVDPRWLSPPALRQRVGELLSQTHPTPQPRWLGQTEADLHQSWELLLE